jgi:hypothetical protein
MSFVQPKFTPGTFYSVKGQNVLSGMKEIVVPYAFYVCEEKGAGQTNLSFMHFEPQKNSYLHKLTVPNGGLILRGLDVIASQLGLYDASITTLEGKPRMREFLTTTQQLLERCRENQQERDLIKGVLVKLLAA